MAKSDIEHTDAVHIAGSTGTEGIVEVSFAVHRLLLAKIERGHTPSAASMMMLREDPEVATALLSPDNAAVAANTVNPTLEVGRRDLGSLENAMVRRSKDNQKFWE